MDAARLRPRTRAIAWAIAWAIAVWLCSAATAAMAATAATGATSVDSPQPSYLRPVRGPIIRHFEPPPSPYAPGHRGIDMETPVGTVVFSSNTGIVAFAGRVAGELFVSIDHAGGIRTTYSFLSAVLVSEGQAVARGEPVARSGTGHAGSDRPHLHFGARLTDGTRDHYVDPEPLLLDGLRRDLSQAIRLWGVEAPPAEWAAGRGSVPRDVLPAMALLGVLRVAAGALGRRRWRRIRRTEEAATRPLSGR